MTVKVNMHLFKLVAYSQNAKVVMRAWNIPGRGRDNLGKNTEKWKIKSMSGDATNSVSVREHWKMSLK